MEAVVCEGKESVHGHKLGRRGGCRGSFYMQGWGAARTKARHPGDTGGARAGKGWKGGLGQGLGEAHVCSLLPPLQKPVLCCVKTLALWTASRAASRHRASPAPLGPRRTGQRASAGNLDSSRAWRAEGKKHVPEALTPRGTSVSTLRCSQRASQLVPGLL